MQLIDNIAFLVPFPLAEPPKSISNTTFWGSERHTTHIYILHWAKMYFVLSVCLELQCNFVGWPLPSAHPQISLTNHPSTHLPLWSDYNWERKDALNISCLFFLIRLVCRVACQDSGYIVHNHSPNIQLVENVNGKCLPGNLYTMHSGLGPEFGTASDLILVLKSFIGHFPF